MRIKIGDTWHEAKAGAPIMIELKPQDKKNIENMLTEATKYAIFTDDEPMTVQEKLEWME